MRDFWSDAEEADEPGRRRRGARAGPRAPRAGAPAKPRHHIVTHYNTVTQVTVGSCCTDAAAPPPPCTAECLWLLRGEIIAWARSVTDWGTLWCSAVPCGVVEQPAAPRMLLPGRADLSAQCEYLERALRSAAPRAGPGAACRR